MAYSVQSDVSNGTLQYIEVRINYFDKAHLNVTIDEIVVPQGTSATEYWWVWDGNRIKMNKAVANGKEVKVRRSTPIGEPLHTFRQGATFKDSTVDENFLQQLYINQENFEGRSGTDIYNDMNHHGYRITSVAPAVDSNDAVPYSQYRADALGATQQRLLAETAANNANAHKVSANNSANSAAASDISAHEAKNLAATSATNASSSASSANAAANIAATKANEASASATMAQNWANAAAAVAVPDNSITEVKLADGSVTANKVANASITNQKLATNSVQSSNIVDNSIVTAKIANNAVASWNIVDGAVTASKVADNAVTATKVADSNITWAKLSADTRTYIDNTNNKINQIWDGYNLTWGLYIKKYPQNDGYHGGRLIFGTANDAVPPMLVETVVHNNTSPLLRIYAQGTTNGAPNRGAYLNLGECSAHVNAQIVTDSTPHTYTRAQRGAIFNLPSSSNVVIDMNSSNNFYLLANQNFTLANPINMVAGQSGIIIIQQDGVGNRIINYGSFFYGNLGVKPTLSTGGSTIDYLSYFVEHSGKIHVSISKGIH